jgi:hypothetical protein
VTVSEQYLAQAPGGYRGGDIMVPALLGKAASKAVSVGDLAVVSLQAEQLGGDASASPSGSSGRSSGDDVESGRAELGAVSIQLARQATSKALDRSATGLATQQVGASRWGATYWTQASVLLLGCCSFVDCWFAPCLLVVEPAGQPVQPF